MRNMAFIIALASLTSACVIQNDNMNSVLWMQTAAEYRGNNINLYQSAISQLGNAVKHKNITAALEQASLYNCIAGIPCKNETMSTLPTSVVLDIDETVLDNSIYQARLIRDKTQWNKETWDKWIESKQATPIPGAIEFIKAAKKQSITIIYITNRRCSKRVGNTDTCPQKKDTIANLLKAGFPAMTAKDRLLLQNEEPGWDQSEKRKRRKFISRQYRIAMLIGDDLGDLAPNVKKISIDKRYKVVNKHKLLYGKYWFQLTNPTYGSWMKPFNEMNKADFLNIGEE